MSPKPEGIITPDTQGIGIRFSLTDKTLFYHRCENNTRRPSTFEPNEEPAVYTCKGLPQEQVISPLRIKKSLPFRTLGRNRGPPTNPAANNTDLYANCQGISGPSSVSFPASDLQTCDGHLATNKSFVPYSTHTSRMTSRGLCCFIQFSSLPDVLLERLEVVFMGLTSFSTAVRRLPSDSTSFRKASTSASMTRAADASAVLRTLRGNMNGSARPCEWSSQSFPSESSLLISTLWKW